MTKDKTRSDAKKKRRNKRWKVGKKYTSRMAMYNDGIHRQSVAGISHGCGKKPAVSVVMGSGGYHDKKDGDMILYEGQGTIPQKMTRYNKSLELSMDRLVPVRVIRRYSKGYKYIGKYIVHGYSQMGCDKPYIFRLVKKK